MEDEVPLRDGPPNAGGALYEGIVDRTSMGRHRIEESQPRESALSVRNQQIAARLVAWIGMALQQHDSPPACGKVDCRGRAGGAAAHDHRVPSLPHEVAGIMLP